MRGFFRSGLIYSLMSMGSLIASSPIVGAGQAEDLRLTVLTHSYVDLPAEALSEAQQRAEKVFALAGIETEWIYCSAVNTQTQDQPPCSQVQGGPTVFSLSIVPRQMAQQYPVHTDTLGFAPLQGDKGFALHAWVFFERVKELVNRHKATGEEEAPSLAVVLGHVIVHEIAHLLGVDHANGGLMKAGWAKNELKQMARTEVFFTPRQAEIVRQELLRRLRIPNVSVELSDGPR